MRLIDVDALVRELEYDVELDSQALDDTDLVGLNRELTQFDKDCKANTITVLREAPTVDAVPVRHGKWIHRGCGVFTCDKCSRDIGLNVYTTEKASERFKYCPNCGAKMDEVE